MAIIKLDDHLYCSCAAEKMEVALTAYRGRISLDPPPGCLHLKIIDMFELHDSIG